MPGIPLRDTHNIGPFFRLIPTPHMEERSIRTQGTRMPDFGISIIPPIADDTRGEIHGGIPLSNSPDGGIYRPHLLQRVRDLRGYVLNGGV